MDGIALALSAVEIGAMVFGCRLILFGGVGSVLLTKQNGSGGHCRQLVKITMAYNASVTGASDSERPS